MINLNIEKLSSEGAGIGFSESKKIEVIGAIPGDLVRVELGKKRRRVTKGFLREILNPSPERTIPQCLHVPECGGCRLQQMQYSAQLLLKESTIKEAFSQLKNFSTTNIQSIIACREPWRYRNKMEFSFSQNREGDRFLGLMLAEGRRRVFNIKECHLVSPWFIQMVDQVRKWWEKSGLLAYFPPKNEGALRTLTLREAKRTTGKLVMLTVSGNPLFALKHSDLKTFVEAVKRSVPEEEHPTLSIFLRVQQIARGHPTQFFEMHLFGPDHIVEELHIDNRSLKFKISPTSFFQPNPLQAETLYQLAIKCAEVSPNTTVFDLYCGTATLAMIFAKQAKHVIGIELNPHAIFDANINKEFNDIDNLTLVQGDVGKVLSERRFEDHPDLIIVDPPRGGLEESARNHVTLLKAKQILYISCNPSTQVRDIQFFEKEGYLCRYVQPVDQFPHTLHIENIALLCLR